jgi:hypothetical protein
VITPFTQASTFFVTIEGRTIPVISADAARIMEIRMEAALKSQSTAWTIIANANWKAQTDEWRTIASYWQNHTFVQPELPLPFPPHIPRTPERLPATLQEANARIAMLEHSLRVAESHLRDAEKFENQMIEKLTHLEAKIHDLQVSCSSFGTN